MHTPIQYGYKGTQQYTIDQDNSPLLQKKGITRIQSITGSFLYYARAMDSTILPALNEISTRQTNPSFETDKNVKN